MLARRLVVAQTLAKVEAAPTLLDGERPMRARELHMTTRAPIRLLHGIRAFYGDLDLETLAPFSGSPKGFRRCSRVSSHPRAALIG